MNKKFAKKLLAVTIAASMMVVPVVAGATDSTSGGSSSSETTATVEETKTVQTSSAVNGVQSTVGGAFVVPEATGIAVRTPVANLNVPDGAKAFEKAYTVSKKSAPAAAAAAEAYAGSQGGNVFFMMNNEFGFMKGGKFERASQDLTFDMTIGLKKKVPADKTVEGGQILPGGAVNPLQDADTNPNTFTATGLKAGLSCIFLFTK